MKTIMHELIGHFGTRNLLGPQFIQKSNQIFNNQAAGEVPSVLSRSSGNDAASVTGFIDVPTAKAALSRITSTLTVAPDTEVVYLFADLPDEVQAEERAQKANEKNTKGLFHNDTLYF